MTARRILIVEDEDHLARVVRMNLELDGHTVEVAPDGSRARAALGKSPFDLIVLDVMLPDADGMDLCREMRAAGDLTPVLMLTALGETSDRIAGLRSGADDYLPKPFELAELRARVGALLRRAGWAESSPPRAQDVVRFGQAEINFVAHEATMNGQPVATTALELELVRYFIDHPGQALSRELLLEEVWGVSGSNATRTVDNFVMRLRRHFEPEPAQPRHFVSVRGVGYKFTAG